MSKKNWRNIQLDLQRCLRDDDSQVLDSGDIGYAETISIDNGRVSHEPFLVVRPSSTEDVAQVVKYCHDQNLKLTAKSGGHTANGYCLNSDGIVLDLSLLSDVSLGEAGDQYARLKVGAGTRWIKAYDHLRMLESNYIAIGGGCPGVGVSGFLLGGGYSFISRSYGLGSDNVQSIEFVSKEGDIIKLNHGSSGDERELFWALRGAGGGNFGLVTEFELKVHKTPTPAMMMGQIAFPFYRIREILPFYNKWVESLPNEMAVYGMLRNFPDVRQNGERILMLRFTPIYNGSFAEGLELLKPLIEQAPFNVELHAMTIPEWENFIGNATLVSGRSAYIRSVVLPAGSLGETKKGVDDVATICMEHMGRAPSPDSYIVWTHMGGKIKEFGKADGCFAHRDASFTFEVKSLWDTAQPELARKSIEWAHRFFEDLSVHGQGAYLNYIDPLLNDWKTAYYGTKIYKRLLKVKNRWDDKGFFTFQQGIGSKFEPDLEKPMDLSPLARTYNHIKR